MPESMQAVCEKIVSLDRTVRFAGMANGGKIVTNKYREGLVPLLTEKESELSVVQSTIRMMLRKPLEEKLGGMVYAFARYGNVKRATIPLRDSLTVLVSFDLESEHDYVIMTKIIPLLQESGLV
ncbi:MAG: hypothetical protein ACREAO_01045 [Nitrososphaera sp.]